MCFEIAIQSYFFLDTLYLHGWDIGEEGCGIKRLTPVLVPIVKPSEKWNTFKKCDRLRRKFKCRLLEDI